MKKLGLMLIIFLFFLPVLRVKAEENVDVYFVFDKESVKKDQEFSLSIDIPRFAKLYNVIIDISFIDDIKVNNDEPFVTSLNSIFEIVKYNKKLTSNRIRGEFITSDYVNGKYSSYKNNVATISFTSKLDIADTTKILKDIKIYLFDINNELISTTVKYSNTINGYWNTDDYLLDINEQPDIEDLFLITNRKKDEYELILENEIDTSIENQIIVQIGVYDYLNGNYQSFSKIFNVLDQTPPIIEDCAQIIVEDKNLNDFNLLDFLVVKDNYSETIKIETYTLYDEELTIDDLTALLKENKTLNCKVLALDDNLNKSKMMIIKFILIDLTSPAIGGFKQIEINDYEIKDFYLDQYFTVSDNIDKDVIIQYSFLNQNIDLNNYKSFLKYKTPLVVKAFAEDKSGNISNEFVCELILIDTINPSFIGENVISINDYEVDNFDFSLSTKFHDNADESLKIEKIFYFENTEITLETTKIFLKEGKEIKSVLTAIDSENNKTVQEVSYKVIDTTSPYIKEINVEEGKIYKTLKQITYEVSDNFRIKELTVLLNGSPYNNQELNKGKYQLIIKALDDADNLLYEEINFTVSNNYVVDNIINSMKIISPIIYVLAIIFILLILTILKYKNHKKLKN